MCIVSSPQKHTHTITCSASCKMNTKYIIPFRRRQEEKTEFHRNRIRFWPNISRTHQTENPTKLVSPRIVFSVFDRPQPSSCMHISHTCTRDAIAAVCECNLAKKLRFQNEKDDSEKQTKPKNRLWVCPANKHIRANGTSDNTRGKLWLKLEAKIVCS